MNILHRIAGVMLLLISYAAAQTWTLANRQISRTVTFTAAQGLFTERLSDPETHADFILPGKLRLSIAPEFSFQCNGHTYQGASADFALLGTEEKPIAKGKSLTVRLRSKQLPLEVSVIYRVYYGHSVIRKQLVLRNTGTTALRFSHLNVEAIAPSVGPENETTLNTQYGTIPREIFYTGRSEDAGLLVANGRTGIGFAVISEVPGYMKRTEIAGWDDAE